MQVGDTGRYDFTADAIDLADLFCRQARRRLATLRRELYCQDDRRAYRVARDLLEGRFAWLNDNIVSTWKQGPDRS